MQGTFEKIRLQLLVGHDSLQLRGLLPQFTLSGVCRRSFEEIDRLWHVKGNFRSGTYRGLGPFASFRLISNGPGFGFRVIG